MVPKLRFKEFCGEWEEKRLGEAVEYITDYVAAGSFADIRKNVTYLEKGYAQLIRTIDLKNNFKNKGFIYVDKHAFEYLYRVNLNEESIVLPNIGANIGESYYINCDKLPHQYNVLAPNSILLKSKMQNNRFIYQFLKTDLFVNRLKLIVAASGQPKFNKTDLKKLKLQVPSLPEQTKVADFLSTVDDKIQNQQDKISHLENIKKGFMQKIFSRKIRFKDDGGEEFTEWEEKKLGDLFEVSAGGDIDLSMCTKNKTDENIYPVYANALEKNGLYAYSKLYKVEGECITVTARGNIGFAIPRKEKFYPIVRLLVLKPKINLNVKFFSEIINSTNILIESTGVPQLTAPQIKKLKIKTTCLKEQQKIADFLSSFDKKISTEEETLEHLKQLKKGLLQQMFV